MSELAEWDSFCVIVGSAAGALIGLQFVVMILIAQNPPLRAAEAGQHSRPRRSSTLGSCCSCPRSFALHGTRLRQLLPSGVSPASAARRIQ